MIHEHDFIVLTEDRRSEGLQAGDVGTVVHVHAAEAGYEVEFTTLGGEPLAVTTLLPSQLRPVSRRDVTHVRELTVS